MAKERRTDQYSQAKDVHKKRLNKIHKQKLASVNNLGKKVDDEIERLRASYHEVSWTATITSPWLSHKTLT